MASSPYRDVAFYFSKTQVGLDFSNFCDTLSLEYKGNARMKKKRIVRSSNLLGKKTRESFAKIIRDLEKAQAKPDDTETSLRKCTIPGCVGKVIEQKTYHKIPDHFGRIPVQDMGWSAESKVFCNKCFVRFEK